MNWIDEELEKLKEKPATPNQVIGLFGIEYQCPCCGEIEGIKPPMDFCPWCRQKFTWFVTKERGTEWQLAEKKQ